MFLPIGDAPTVRGPRPWVNHVLIGVNVAVYVAGLFTLHGEAEHLAWTQSWGLVPIAPRAATFLTHMFLHGGILHLAGNMLMLWVFGANVERRLGHLGYLLTYLACGLAAALFFLLLNPLSTVPMVGASGAIFGIAGFYFVAFPRHSVHVLFWMVFIFTFWMPARLLVGFMFLMDLWFTFAHYGEMQGGGTAFAAHVGGFLGGAGLAFALRATRPRTERVPAESAADDEALALLEQARLLLEGRRYDEAQAVLSEILHQQLHTREAPEAALLLGHLLARVQGRPEAALEVLAFAARLHPDPEARQAASREIARIRG